MQRTRMYATDTFCISFGLEIAGEKSVVLCSTSDSAAPVYFCSNAEAFLLFQSWTDTCKTKFELRIISPRTKLGYA